MWARAAPQATAFLSEVIQVEIDSGIDGGFGQGIWRPEVKDGVRVLAGSLAGVCVQQFRGRRCVGRQLGGGYCLNLCDRLRVQEAAFWRLQLCFQPGADSRSGRGRYRPTLRPLHELRIAIVFNESGEGYHCGQRVWIRLVELQAERRGTEDMTGTDNQQRFLVFLQNLIADDANVVVVALRQIGLEVLEGVDFGPVNLGLYQQQFDSALEG